jgi:hypothetical protein
MTWRLLLIAGLLVLSAVPAAERSDAYTIVDTPLSADAFSDAAKLTNVPSHTDLNVLARKGGWYQVVLATGQTGWLRLTAIEFDRPAAKTRSSVVAGILSLFESGRSGANGTTAATGLRGLNTGDIAKAQPDTAAVDSLDAWEAKAADARQYSAALPLVPHSVAYVDAEGAPVKP